MKKYSFTIMMLLTILISLPTMWQKLLVSASNPPRTEISISEPIAPTEPSVPKFVEPEETFSPESAEPPTKPPLPEEPFETEEAPLPDTDTVKTFTSVDRSYWDNTLFIGDSRTVGLAEYADLGSADVFAYSGMSVYKVFEKELSVNGSEKQTLENLLLHRQYDKIYIMMGINELGYYFEPTIERYQNMVDYIQKLQPNAIIFLEANLHVTQEKSSSDKIYNNAGINRINQAISDMADGCAKFYVDVNTLFDDGQGNLDASYTADDSHVLGKYYAAWADWLLTKGIL